MNKLNQIIATENALTSMAVVPDGDPYSDFDGLWSILNDYRQRLITSLKPEDDLKLEMIKYDLTLGAGLN